MPIYTVLKTWIDCESYQCRTAICGQYNMGFLSGQGISTVVLVALLADLVQSGNCIRHGSHVPPDDI